MDDSSPDINKLELNKLKWSTTNFTVSEFLKKFKLPQVVKVTSGFYGENDESTLEEDQVLCLLSVKSIRKLHGRDSSGKDTISIALDCQKKIEVSPSNLKDVYENVEELCSAFPSYVRISQGYYDASKDEEILNVGDKLQLKSIAKTKKGEKTLICVNQNGHTVELPKDCVAGFQPMADGKEYYLAEVLKKFSLPLYVRFVEPYTMDQRTRSKDKPLYQPPGTIYLDRTSTRTVITATTMRNNGEQSMVQFSPDIDICLLVCEDAFRESADYVNICHSFNQDVDNQNIYTAISEYIDMTQNLREFSLNVASKSGSKNIKKGVPPLKKTSKPKPAKVIPPRPRLGSSKAKSNRAKAIPSKPVLPKDEIEQTYTDPNEIYEEIGFTEPTYTECRFLDNSTYTELDPPNIPTNSHEYAKPDVKHPAESNPITPAILSSKSTPTSGNKQPAKSNPPSHLGSQLSATSDSNQPVESGSNSILCNRRPPPVPDRLPSRRNRSVILTNPHLPNNAVALPIRALPDNPPQLPSRFKVPDRKTDVSTVHERKTAPTDSHESPTMVTNTNPALPTSLPGQPPSLPTNIMPVPTPEQKEEIYEAISKYPIDLSSLSITDVSALLNYLGMGKYVETFEAELIDGAMLASMDKESLESLNLIPFHVTKLIKFIGGWRPNSKIRSKTPC